MHVIHGRDPMGQVVKWQTNQKRLEESNGLHDLQRLTKTKEITQFVFCNNTRDFVNVLPNKKRETLATYVILTPVCRTRVISCCISAFAISFNSGWGVISDSSLETNTRTSEIITLGINH